MSDEIQREGSNFKHKKVSPSALSKPDEANKKKILISTNNSGKPSKIGGR